MFTYFHCYLPRTWDAQVKAGLINAHSGVRFCESIDIEESLKFNRLATEDGELFHIIKENGLPLYIDRLQGGCYIEKYPYNMPLVNRYRELLGEKFYGFQMHEWMSNYRNDLNKIMKNPYAAWAKETIIDVIRKEFPFPHLFLEAMDADEMAAFGNPKSYADFLEKATALFAMRQTYTDGTLLPCDSFFLSYPLELRAGVKRLMPEIGAQTPDTRIQVAYARGMTKAIGGSFGTYYEPWGGSPFSACSYQRDGENEWNIHSAADFPSQTNGVNGGSSRSMQRRMHLYSYMAGAQFMAEEWGMCNTFYDWKEFTLSPYGEIKRDFIRFTEKYSDIGTPVTPIAVVLPRDMPALEGVRRDDSVYLGYPISGSFADKVRNVRMNLRKIFTESGKMLGTETTSLLNCVIPDAIDIVNEDFVDPSMYAYLVDLTDSAAFAKQNAEKLCTADEIAEILKRFLPCTVHGNSLKQFTRTQDGAYYMLLTNNSGIVRSAELGEVCMPEATEAQTIDAGNRKLLVLEGSAVCRDEQGLYHTELPAGGYLFAKLVG